MGPDRLQWHERTDGFISWTLVTTFEVGGMFDEVGEILRFRMLSQDLC